MFTTVMTVRYVLIHQVAFLVLVFLVSKVMDLSVMTKMNVLVKKIIVLFLPHVAILMVVSNVIVKMDSKVMVSHVMISTNARTVITHVT